MWSDVWWKDWPCRSVVHGGTGDGTLEERRYYLQNWRNDVMELVSATGARVERYRYDAYGRPNSFSPGDVAGFAGGPDSLMNGTDTTAFNAAYAGGTGSVSWITDLVPDNAVNSADNTAYGNYLSAGWTGGFGLMSDSSIDNRKGFAGYEFDPVLAGTIASGGTLPVYHVRNRVLNCDTGKWMQKDPMGYADSMDLYEYCASDPVDKNDPMGLCADKNGLTFNSACGKSPLSCKRSIDLSAGLVQKQAISDAKRPCDPPWEMRFSFSVCFMGDPITASSRYPGKTCAEKCSAYSTEITSCCQFVTNFDCKYKVPEGCDMLWGDWNINVCDGYLKSECEIAAGYYWSVCFWGCNRSEHPNWNDPFPTVRPSPWPWPWNPPSQPVTRHKRQNLFEELFSPAICQRANPPSWCAMSRKYK